MAEAKHAAGINVPRLGFHAQKRAGVRREAFRELPAKVQEKLTSTTHETLRRVYDEVSLEQLRKEMGKQEKASRGSRRKAA